MVDDMLELEVDKIIDETTRKVTAEVTAEVTEKVMTEVTEKVTAEVTEKVTESNIKGMIEILSSAGFDKNEITDMIAEKFKIDKAYVEKLFE